MNSAAPAPKTRLTGFASTLLLLVSSTALAHGITAAAMPMLSRLYSPAAFGLLTVFSGLAAIIGSAACLRYDLAVSVSDSTETAARLFKLALFSALSIGLLLLPATTLYAEASALLLSQAALKPYLWLLPLCVVMAGCLSALQFWLVRFKAFAALARLRVMQSAGTVLTQLAAGLCGSGPTGLLWGAPVGMLAALLLERHRVGSLVGANVLRACAGTARRYAAYPLLSTPEALANTAGQHLPLLLIAALAGPAEAGQLGMAIYLLQVPSALLGQSISQFYLSHAPEANAEHRLGRSTATVLGRLLAIGLGPFLAVGLLAPHFFPLILGDQWLRAGYLAAWMTPWFALQFLTAPISMALHIRARQGLALGLQLSGLLIRGAPVLLLAQSPASSLGLVLALSSAVFYLIYLCMALRIADCNRRDIGEALRSALLPTAAWLFPALLLALALSAKL